MKHCVIGQQPATDLSADEVELDEVCNPFIVHHLEGVCAEAIHVTVAVWNSTVTVQPANLVCALLANAAEQI